MQSILVKFSGSAGQPGGITPLPQAEELIISDRVIGSRQISQTSL